MPKRESGVQTFEIRLREVRPDASLLFVARRETDEEAVDHARRLLARHPEFHLAEVWRERKLLRQI